MKAVYSLKENGVYGEGEEVEIRVLYSHAMDVFGTPSIALNSGGNAQFTMKGRKQVSYYG